MGTRKRLTLSRTTLRNLNARVARPHEVRRAPAGPITPLPTLALGICTSDTEECTGDNCQWSQNADCQTEASEVGTCWQDTCGNTCAETCNDKTCADTCANTCGDTCADTCDDATCVDCNGGGGGGGPSNGCKTDNTICI